MVEPSCAVASTISGASVLGSTWRSAMRVSLMPIDLAASTNGSSRSASVLARITRATVGIRGIAIAMITFGSDGPSAAVITSASTSSGKRLQDIGNPLEHQIDPARQITRCETDDDADRTSRARSSRCRRRAKCARRGRSGSRRRGRTSPFPASAGHWGRQRCAGIDAERIEAADQIGRCRHPHEQSP